MGTSGKFSSGGSVSPLPSLIPLLSLQVGMTAPGTQRHIYSTKLGIDKCDNSSMSPADGLHTGCQVVESLAWACLRLGVLPSKVQRPAGAPAAAGDGPGPGSPPVPPYYQEEAGY